MALRAKKIKDAGKSLSHERLQGNGGRKWRKQFLELQQQMQLLEEDNDKLLEAYPQGEDPDAAWVSTVLGYYFTAFLGVVTGCMDIIFVIHVIVYMLTVPPVFLFLNTMFVELDNGFPLFGTLAFSLFCLYIIVAVSCCWCWCCYRCFFFFVCIEREKLRYR